MGSCCAAPWGNPASSDTSFRKYKPFRRTTTFLPSPKSFTMLVFSFKASWEGEKIFAFFFYSLLFFPLSLFLSSCLCSSLSLTPVCSTVRRHQCYLNCDINSHINCTKKRHFWMRALRSKMEHLFWKQSINICWRHSDNFSKICNITQV